MVPPGSKAVTGFPAYRVDRQGNVWSCWIKIRRENGLVWELGKIWLKLTPQVMPKGYCCVSLRHNRQIKRKLVHKLILEAFVGPCPAGQEGCHNDGNASHNNITNLRWDTPKNNAADKKKHGIYRRGSKHGLAKLTEQAVQIIRQSCETQQALALRFGVARSLISLVKHKKVWGWLSDAPA